MIFPILFLLLNACQTNGSKAKFKYSSCTFPVYYSGNHYVHVHIISSFYNDESEDKKSNVCNIFTAVDIYTKDTLNLIALSPFLSKSQDEKYNNSNQLLFIKYNKQDCLEFYSNLDIDSRIKNKFPTLLGGLYYYSE